MNNPGGLCGTDFLLPRIILQFCFLTGKFSNIHDSTTFIRIRLCSAANQCIAPTGTVDNGEVETMP
ncbi:hypothetical protein [Photobacterium leiognathi]|uniref:hypothetical protein n=1 Tax=Photobacterium leiognathi TaxID=553611 RepID=UPI002736A62A|nr:hypothetical protein [Photobacterium leiognathi]